MELACVLAIFLVVSVLCAYCQGVIINVLADCSENKNPPPEHNIKTCA